MAGDYDDEYQDEELDEEDLDEELEEQENEELAEEERELKVAQGKIYVREMQKILTRQHGVRGTFWPFYSFKEKHTIKQANKFAATNKGAQFSTINAKIKLLNNQLQTTNKMKKEAWKAKIKVIAPFIPCILIAFIVILGICIAVGVISSSVFGWLNGGGGMGSIEGTDGAAMYGARLVYKDEEESRSALISDYVSIIGGSITSIEQNTSGVDINIDLPENIAEYDFSSVNATNEADVLKNFKTDYLSAYNLLEQVVKAVYDFDFVEGDLVATTLKSRLDGIKYFGITNEMVSTESKTGIADVISNYILTNSLYTLPEGSTPDVDQIVETGITNYFATYNFYRAEKLFIEDHIYTGEDGLKDVKSHNYVAFIYLPKSSVTYSKFELLFAQINPEEFTAKAVNNSSETSLTAPTEFGSEKDEHGNTAIVYECDYSNSLTFSTFSGFDASNPNQFKKAKSIAQIVADNASNSAITTQTTESGITVYTYQKPATYFAFESNQNFMFAESYVN